MELLQLIGFVIIAVGSLGTLIAAFSTSIWWGLGCLLIYPVSLAFLLFHWDVAKNPFFLQILGLALLIIGSSN